MIYGSCAPELQNIAIKVLSQTTSATNCERNWSTFSYIHTKTRNRLKYKKLQKLVFTFYNMKLKMRHTMRKSQEEIENSFNPINLDYIFKDDPLSPWVEEREDPLLDGIQNSEWLPRIDTDDEEMEAGDDSNSDGGSSHSGGDGGLSPPSNNSDGGDNDGATGSGHGIDEYREADPYQEIPEIMRGQGFVVDMTSFQDRDPSDSRRGGSQSSRGGRQQGVLEDSASSNFSQSFSDFGIGESSQSSQGYYPPYYQQPSYLSHDHYPTIQPPSYYQPSINYQQPYHQQTENTSGGFFDYLFGQRARQGDNQEESEGYDPPRHSTMW